MSEVGWLLLVAQLPAHPSSARVQLWRHLRSAGAVSLQNGVWVLPAGEAHDRLLRDELASESRAGKETYGELEGSEQKLAKQDRWLAQIRSRDFFEAPTATRAAQAVEACRTNLGAFAAAVYRREGVTDGTVEEESAATAKDEG